MLVEHRLPDRGTLDIAIASAVEQRLADALRARGTASIAVSGGRSPTGWFERLSKAPLDWSRVAVALVDERWVPESSEHSNAALVKRHLLQGPARAARFVALYDGGPNPQTSLEAVERSLDALAWPLDIAVLGMGEDGHTASWFPDAPEYAAAVDPGTQRRLAAIHTAKSPYPRITLTRAALLDGTRWIAVEWSGAAKAPTYERARARETATLPISLVLHQHAVPVEVFSAH